MPSVNTRAFFSKTDRAKYISHLDLNGVIQRAIRRSRLPIWRTEGFNPHVYIQFMLPLPLGQEGVHEAVDFRMLQPLPPQEIIDRLNAALPDGICITAVSSPDRGSGDIALAEYDIYGDINPNAFAEFLSQDSIITEKKTKKGTAEIDLKPLIAAAESNAERITLRLPAGSSLNINPTLVLNAFAAFTSASAAQGAHLPPLRIIRTKILCADGTEFA